MPIVWLGQGDAQQRDVAGLGAELAPAGLAARGEQVTVPMAGRQVSDGAFAHLACPRARPASRHTRP
jgi:hypothetical protein